MKPTSVQYKQATGAIQVVFMLDLANPGDDMSLSQLKINFGKFANKFYGLSVLECCCLNVLLKFKKIRNRVMKDAKNGLQMRSDVSSNPGFSATNQFNVSVDSRLPITNKLVYINVFNLSFLFSKYSARFLLHRHDF